MRWSRARSWRRCEVAQFPARKWGGFDDFRTLDGKAPDPPGGRPRRDRGDPASLRGADRAMRRSGGGGLYKHRVVGRAGQSLNALESENRTRALRLELSGAR